MPKPRITRDVKWQDTIDIKRKFTLTQPMFQLLSTEKVRYRLQGFQPVLFTSFIFTLDIYTISA